MHEAPVLHSVAVHPLVSTSMTPHLVAPRLDIGSEQHGRRDLD